MFLTLLCMLDPHISTDLELIYRTLIGTSKGRALVQIVDNKDTKEQFVSGNRATIRAIGLNEASAYASWRINRYEATRSSQLSVILRRSHVAGQQRLAS